MESKVRRESAEGSHLSSAHHSLFLLDSIQPESTLPLVLRLRRCACGQYFGYEEREMSCKAESPLSCPPLSPNSSGRILNFSRYIQTGCEGRMTVAGRGHWPMSLEDPFSKVIAGV